MDFLKNFTPTPANVLKLAGVGLLGVVVLALVISLAGTSFRSFSTLIGSQGISMGGMGGYAVAPSGPSYGYGADMAYDESVKQYYAGAPSPMPGISTRNVASSMPPIAPIPGGTAVGGDAEEFEVTDYSAHIETRNLSRTCGAILDLKTKDYVVFLNSNEGDRNCSFSFKVKHDRVNEILGAIKDLGPKDLNENTRTIKQELDDFTSAEDTLKKKLASIDETLENALSAYDEITRIATRAQDPDALAKIIEGKIQLIERLTQERLSINAQLEQLSRSKAQQLDRIDYTYFSVSVFEDKYFDGEDLVDSWKNALREFFFNANRVLQDLTVNFVLLLLLAIQYLVYFFVLLVIVKYAWQAAKALWNR